MLHEILLALESEDVDETVGNLIHVELPIEQSGQVTGKDSNKSDEEHDANLKHMGERLLQNHCQL